MKLIEHLEGIIGLIERGATRSEIKGACVALHEELSGRDRDAEELAQFHSKLKQLLPEKERFITALMNENKSLKAKSAPPVTRVRLDVPPDFGAGGVE